MRQIGELPVSEIEGGLRIAVRLTPKASSDAIGPIMELGGRPVLTARVRAIPDNGAANAALQKLIAKWLGLPQALVWLAAGGKSRLKTIEVKGDPGALGARIAELLSGPERP